MAKLLIASEGMDKKMADISKITLPNGTTYNIKDAQARDDIAAIQSAIAGGVTFMGETTTALTDGATTTTITINSASVTAVKGYLVVYNSKEFVFDGTKWIEMGDLSLIGDLGWKDSASASYTPTGSVSKPTFEGDTLVSNGYFTPAGSVKLESNATQGTGRIPYISDIFGPTQLSGTPATIKSKVTAAGNVTIATGNGTANYKPGGSVTAPTISVKNAGSTTTVNSITNVGTLPSLTTTVANETLTIGFSQGTLPTKGANTTVKTGDAEYQASAPTFTGSDVELTATFQGIEVEGSANYTPAGSVNVATGVKYLSSSFTGTQGNVTVTGTPSGTISKPTFDGTQATITVT